MPYTRSFLVCDTCKGRAKLWLGGSDYVECPACDAKGSTEIIQERVQARVQERFIPSFAGGYIKHTAILTPHSGWRDSHGSV